MTITDPKIDYDLAKKTRDILVERFPKCFAPVGGVKKPLKIGIKTDLRREVRDLKPFALHCMLTDYTRGPHYLMCLSPGATRVDLNGDPAGTVSENDHAFAALRAAGARHDDAIMNAIRDAGITVLAIESGYLKDLLKAPKPPENFSVLMPAELLNWGLEYYHWWNRAFWDQRGDQQ